MSRLSLLLLCSLIAGVLSQNFCPQCKDMCADARTNYKNDFSQVTQPQLQTFMEGECKLKFTGAEVAVCRSFIDTNSKQMLADFKNGLSNDQICQNGGLC